MKKRAVIALGGNALGNTLPEQMIAVKGTSKVIVDLVEAGYDVVVTHGNGPQVGMINNAMAALSRENPKQPNTPLSVCVAMSQAYIGYDLQNAIREELLNRNIKDLAVSTMVTQVRVDEEDPAFQHPTKPIGHFMTEEEAKYAEEHYDYKCVEDSGRGWRRVVASPAPVEIVELEAIKQLVGKQLVICCGGGGIPVVHNGNHLSGASAVIDKDWTSSLLAAEIDADVFIILTAVEKVAVNFGKPDQQWLDDITVEEARQYAAEGQFAAGSMLPKVDAAIKFAESKKGRTAIITLLEKAREGIEGKTGTRIHL
ncbi:carbamate kinase [Veillonella magna]|uniref:Carbamate kinase n=1 Tax=Veillonella magna TaxID=464322 RepID=A0ABS2GDQ2_9FIRM|nr:carbamate kinase [Veillonella magna]MBM6823606.1 carbamate kinase [Veillonella magna]MBM6912136.1 carbamate kinase [Veillonella magna]